MCTKGPIRDASRYSLACCFPLATVVDGQGTLRAGKDTRRHVRYVVVGGILPGRGHPAAVDALGAVLAGTLDLPGDRFLVVPPVAPVPYDLPPGYPADPALVFGKDGAGKWHVAPSMDKGRAKSLAEQWEAMRA